MGGNQKEREWRVLRGFFDRVRCAPRCASRGANYAAAPSPNGWRAL